jgi:hypothetical protein
LVARVAEKNPLRHLKVRWHSALIGVDFHYGRRDGKSQ